MSRRDGEARIIARAQRGHAEAYRALVEAYKDRLFAFVWRMMRHHHDAEDVCQAAFVKAYESLATYDRRFAFSTWLFTIAYRLCLNRLRKRRGLTGDVDLSNVGGGADAAEALASSEDALRLRTRVWSAVDELSDVQKCAVLLFYREGRSCQEIGEVLSIPPVTVKSHLHRAREKLRTMLQADFDREDVPARRVAEAGGA